MLEKILVVGTSHISNDSIKKIDSALLNFKPEVVAVELDQNRYVALLHKKQSSPKFSDIRKIGVVGYFFVIFGQKMQKKLGNIVGVEPGADMLHAIKVCRANKFQLALIDRDIELTLKRLSTEFSFKEKLRLLKDLLISPFVKKKVSLDLSKIPKKDFIVVVLKELKQRYPGLHKVLIDERNKHMAKELFKLARQNKHVLCVVGAGHEEGILKELKNLDQNNLSSVRI